MGFMFFAVFCSLYCPSSLDSGKRRRTYFLKFVCGLSLIGEGRGNMVFRRRRPAAALPAPIPARPYPSHGPPARPHQPTPPIIQGMMGEIQEHAPRNPSQQRASELSGNVLRQYPAAAIIQQGTDELRQRRQGIHFRTRNGAGSSWS